jgi:hypothetical protein
MSWPFPAEGQDPWFEALEGFFNATDQSGYASREDRHIILQGGGPISFAASGVLSFGSDLEILAAITGFQWRVDGPTSVTMDDGQVLYVDLVRAPTNSLPVTPVVASQVPSSDSALILAVRRGSTIYFRNGASLLVSESLASIAASGGGGSVFPVAFQVNDNLGFITTPTNFLDGLRELGVAGEVSAVIVSQEIDGTAGNTKVELYKVDPSGAETQITVTDSISLAFGGGDKARLVTTVFNAGTTTLSATDRLGVKLTEGQTGGEDLTITVVLSGALSTPPAVPEDKIVVQALSDSQLGTTFKLVGSVYLESGTLIAAESRVLIGVDNPTDDAIFQMRDFSTSTTLTTQTATGLIQDLTFGATNITIPATDWYDMFIRASTAPATATILGVRLVVESQLGVRVRQALVDQTTGTTFKLVGSVYLPAGNLQASSRVLAGTVSGGTDEATLELRQFGSVTALATWTATGLLQDELLGSTVSLPANAWYDLMLKGSGAAITALLRGIDLVVVE